MMLSCFFPLLFFFNFNLNCSKCCIQKEQSEGKENIFHFIQ